MTSKKKEKMNGSERGKIPKTIVSAAAAAQDNPFLPSINSQNRK
jgi:hypothetical protein